MDPRLAALGLLSPQDVAEWLTVSVATLADWRAQKRSPRYVKTGKRVHFRLTDLEKWIHQSYGPPSEAREVGVSVPVRRGPRHKSDGLGGYQTKQEKSREALATMH